MAPKLGLPRRSPTHVRSRSPLPRFLKAAAVLSLALYVVSCSKRAEPGASAPSQRRLSKIVPYSGAAWLAMDSASRKALVTGYLIGAADGQHSGCTIFSNSIEATAAGASLGHSLLEQKREECEPENLRRFTKSPDFYESILTGFYVKYPEDADIPYPALLPQLADQTDVEKTPEGIHKHIRMTR